MNDFETIESFNNYVDAHFAKQKLEEHEILCYLADENTVAIKWIISNAVGGIKLRVPAADKERAIAILKQKEEAIAIDHTIEIREGDELICPKCQSNNTATERVSKTSIGWSWLVLGVPISLNLIKDHRCFYCGNQWES